MSRITRVCPSFPATSSMKLSAVSGWKSVFRKQILPQGIVQEDKESLLRVVSFQYAAENLVLSIVFSRNQSGVS